MVLCRFRCICQSRGYYSVLCNEFARTGTIHYQRCANPISFVGEQYQYDSAFSIFGFCSSLQQLIIFDRSVVKDPRDVSSIYFDEFMAMGEGLPHNEVVEERTARASYDDLANILYTSGTTGNLKV